jgi:hypothetical protein
MLQRYRQRDENDADTDEYCRYAQWRCDRAPGGVAEKAGGGNGRTVTRGF